MRLTRALRTPASVTTSARTIQPGLPQVTQSENGDEWSEGLHKVVPEAEYALILTLGHTSANEWISTSPVPIALTIVESASRRALPPGSLCHLEVHFTESRRPGRSQAGRQRARTSGLGGSGGYVLPIPRSLQSQDQRIHDVAMTISYSQQSRPRLMHRFARRGQLMLMLAGVLIAVAVSACGSSGSVSSAVKAKLVSTLTQAGLSRTQATKVTACLVPVLKSHGITTIADAQAIKTSPAWLESASKSCTRKVL